MINRIKLILDQSEYSALLEAALVELRNPSDQARYMVRQELVRLGLLVLSLETSTSDSDNQARVIAYPEVGVSD